MQYSTNSNEAMRAIVRARPTIIGQYRQARLEHDRRMQDLAKTEFALRREAIRRQWLQEQIRTLEEKCALGLDPINSRHQLELLKIDIEEIELAIANSQSLVADAQREVLVCREEMARIASEVSVDFESLTEAEFQKLMAEEYRLRLSRHLCAHFASLKTGLRPELVEALLDIPVEERSQYLVAIDQEAEKLMSTYFPHLLPHANHNPD